MKKINKVNKITEKNKELEKEAVFANFLSLICCFGAIVLSRRFFTVVFCAFFLLQFVHAFFGDLTTSYIILKKKSFRIFYLSLLIALSMSLLGIFIISQNAFFLLAFASFLADSVATSLRRKKIDNKIKGLVGILKSK